jgi:DNA-binding ferritin-like protein
MNEHTMGNAMIQLADLANCASGDFHCLHFNFAGAEFDELHRNVLKTYYEEAAEDFDELNEKASMYAVWVPSPNEAATRLEYKSCGAEPIQKGPCVAKVNHIIDTIVKAYTETFKLFNDLTDCPRSVGVANFLQTRIEYWSKEQYYFNARRIAG